MADQSVDAAASTSNKRKKLTDEERLARKRESGRTYRAANKEKVAEYQRKYRESNKERITEQKQKYYKRNKSKLKLYGKLWRQENKDEMRSYHRHYKRTKRKNDPSYKFCMYQRARLNKLIHGKHQSGSAVRDMGCTGQEACDYLESLFNEHMTWDNWGTYWQVDHIYPLAAANVEDRVEFLAVNNWRNLQPLEASENLRKGDTVTPEAQKLFDDLKTQFLKEDAA